MFICGHYEGYDERIREHLVTDEISIGDFVLTGGELPAMMIANSVVRLLPHVLGKKRLISKIHLVQVCLSIRTIQDQLIIKD